MKRITIENRAGCVPLCLLDLVNYAFKTYLNKIYGANNGISVTLEIQGLLLVIRRRDDDFSVIVKKKKREKGVMEK
jgi:hypothetical protein